MNALQYLNSLRPAIPLSVEKPCTIMTNGELKRHLIQKAILINGFSMAPEEKIDFSVLSLVFFPSSKSRRTTLL